MKTCLFLLALPLFFGFFPGPPCFPCSEVRPAVAGSRAGKDRAVFFAVEKYKSPKLTDLQNPVKNARDIAGALKSRFGFDTLVLVNPTQAQIITKLEELKRLYTRNDDGKHPADGQLFLFFSGHGTAQYDNGFFLPADAEPASPWEKGIAYEIWRPFINQINCRHILVAIDACYSVHFDPDWKNRPDGDFKRPGEMTDDQLVLFNFENYKARVFFTSDNKENRTPDRSNFAKKLLEGLRSGIARDGFLTSKQIFANFVEGAIPTPRAGAFGDDEASSAFLFYDLRQPAKLSTSGVNTAAEDRAFDKARSRNTVDAYQDYLDVFPNGVHKAACEAAIAALKKKNDPGQSTGRDNNNPPILNSAKDKTPATPPKVWKYTHLTTPGEYEALAQTKKDQSKPEDALTIITEGRQRFPDDSPLLFADININLALNNLTVLPDKLKQAIALEPENASLYVTLGSVYDNFWQKYSSEKNTGKAEEAFSEAEFYYSKGLSIDPKNFDCLYAAGALHYNKAAFLTQELNGLADDFSSEGLKKHQTLKDEIMRIFQTSLPYFQKAEAIDPNEMNTIIALKEIYGRMDNITLASEFQKRLETLRNGNKNPASYFRF